MVEKIPLDGLDEVLMNTPTLQPESVVNWNVVKLVMDGYTEKHPEEIVGCMEYVKQLKATKENAFASSGDNMRHLYELPSRLQKGLALKYPELFQGDNLKQFLELYPAFQVADKV